MCEITFTANKGSFKNTIAANETANLIFKPQTRGFKPQLLKISYNLYWKRDRGFMCL